MSLEPALAALSGMIFLGETLKLSQTLALGAIIIASMGATLDVYKRQLPVGGELRRLTDIIHRHPLATLVPRPLRLHAGDVISP